MIHSLVGCLSAGRGEDASGPRLCQDVVADLEDLLQSQPEHYADLTALRADHAVPDEGLRRRGSTLWASVLPLTFICILRTKPGVRRASDQHRRIGRTSRRLLDDGLEVTDGPSGAFPPILQTDRVWRMMAVFCGPSPVLKRAGPVYEAAARARL